MESIPILKLKNFTVALYKTIIMEDENKMHVNENDIWTIGINIVEYIGLIIWFYNNIKIIIHLFFLLFCIIEKN